MAAIQMSHQLSQKMSSQGFDLRNGKMGLQHMETLIRVPERMTVREYERYSESHFVELSVNIC